MGYRRLDLLGLLGQRLQQPGVVADHQAGSAGRHFSCDIFRVHSMHSLCCALQFLHKHQR